MTFWKNLKPQYRVILSLLALMVMLLILNLFKPQPKPSAGATVSKPAPEVANMTREPITPKLVKAYPRKAKKKLSLPDPVIDNPSIYALSASRVEPDFYPVTVTSTLDAETGEVQTYEKREPLPWIALPKRGEIGVAYGIKNEQPNIRLFARQSLLDVKALRIGVEATVDQDSDYFAGVSLSYRW